MFETLMSDIKSNTSWLEYQFLKRKSQKEKTKQKPQQKETEEEKQGALLIFAVFVKKNRSDNFERRERIVCLYQKRKV